MVIGHPKTDSPAYGWVEALKREGKTLLAKLKQVQPDFAELVRAGRYKKRSICLNGDGSLRHVGFLGGAPPAVKGLAEVRFAEGGDLHLFEFAACEEEVLDGTPDTAPGDAAPEANTETTSTEGDGNMEEIAKLKTDLETLREQFAGAQAEAREQAQAFSDLQGANTLLQERNSQLEAKLAVAEKLIAAEREARAMEARRAFCEALVAEGKLPPGLKELAIEALSAVESPASFAFAEGESAGTKVRALFSALPAFEPKPLETEKAAPVAGGAGAAFSAKVDALLKSNENMGYGDAFTIVSRENPQLAMDMAAEGRM